MKQFSAEEERFHQEIRSVYNKGNGALAVEMSKGLLDKFPNSQLAQFVFGVVHGDYSYDEAQSIEEKSRLRSIAKKSIEKLFSDPNLDSCPPTFVRTVKNEYFWFSEMPEEQYKLGIEVVRKGEDLRGGHYSACVGASMLALKQINSGGVQNSQKWAEISLQHFHDFERCDPTWYNINFFAAQALACLGRFDEAVECYRATFKKQGNPENQNAISEFKLEIDSIKSRLTGGGTMTKEQMKSVIDKMIAAYNKHDAEGFLACFHPEMKSQRLISNVEVAQNLEEFKKFFATAFETNPNLKCEIKNQIFLDNAIVNEEFATGAENFPQGIHAAFVYSFKDGRIHRVWSTR